MSPYQSIRQKKNTGMLVCFWFLFLLLALKEKGEFFYQISSRISFLGGYFCSKKKMGTLREEVGIDKGPSQLQYKHLLVV